MAGGEINRSGELTLEYIADIEFVPPPAEMPIWLPVAGVLLLLLLLAVFLRRRSIDRRRHGLRYLKRLKRLHAGGEIDDRLAVYELAALVRSAAGVTRLTDNLSGMAAEGAHWKVFCERLAKARYTREGVSAEETARLIGEGADWVRRWR